MVSDDVRKDGSSDEPVPTLDGSQRAGSPEQRGDVTQILSAIEQGDGQAAEQLLPLVYEELRKLAAAKMAQEKPGQTLQATALVHEAYIRLVDVEKAQHWDVAWPLLCGCCRGHAADSGGTSRETKGERTSRFRATESTSRIMLPLTRPDRRLAVASMKP